MSQFDREHDFLFDFNTDYVSIFCHQCFDAVAWVARRASVCPIGRAYLVSHNAEAT